MCRSSRIYGVLAGIALAIALATPNATAGRSRTHGRSPYTYFSTLDLLRLNHFNVGRDIGEYREGLHRFDRARNFLKSKGAEGRWIDMGAGEARAQRGFVRRLRRLNRPVPQLIALGYKLPAWLDRAALTTELGHEYVEGLQGPRSIRALPKADLITDFMGIFTYYDEGDRTRVLQSYVDRLTLGGSALVHSYEFTLLSVRPWLDAQAAKGRIEYEFGRDGTSVAIRRLGGPPTAAEP